MKVIKKKTNQSSWDEVEARISFCDFLSPEEKKAKIEKMNELLLEGAFGYLRAKGQGKQKKVAKNGNFVRIQA